VKEALLFLLAAAGVGVVFFGAARRVPGRFPARQAGLALLALSALCLLALLWLAQEIL
jgi:hypothetical protein